MLAHVNAVGVHIPIWLVSNNPTIGWGQNSLYPNEEGTFMGNIFTLSQTVTNSSNQFVVEAYYCEGSGFANGTVAGRLGDVNQSDVYANAYGGLGSPPPKCTDRCTKADYPNDKDGYKQCSSLAPTGLHGSPRVGNHIITVWRGAGTTGTSTTTTTTTTTTGTIRYDFESSTQSSCPATMSGRIPGTTSAC